MAIENVFIDDERWYRNTETGQQVPGVSAILNMMPKNMLTKAATKTAANYVVDKFDKLAPVIESNKTRAIELIKNAHSREWTKKAELGTEVHSYAEMVARAVMAGTKPQGAVPKHIIPYLRNYVRFIKEYDVMPVMLETIVWDDVVGFAGRLDMAAKLRAISDKDIVIVDTKAGASGIWPTTSLQQTAYSFAESYYDPLTETFHPMPETTAAYGLWLRPEGYALQPVETTLAEWEEFKRLRGSFEWTSKRSKKVVGKAINENPIRRQWQGWKK